MKNKEPGSSWGVCLFVFQMTCFASGLSLDSNAQNSARDDAPPQRATRLTHRSVFWRRTEDGDLKQSAQIQRENRPAQPEAGGGDRGV